MSVIDISFEVSTEVFLFRSELVFATEPLLSTLALSIPDPSSRHKPQVELDEVEVGSWA